MMHTSAVPALTVSSLVALAALTAEPDALWCAVRESGRPADSALRVEARAGQPVTGSGMAVTMALRDLAGGRRADVAVTDTTGTEREILVEWQVACSGPFTNLFVTDGQGDRALKPTGTAAYRAPLALPAVTVYGQDSGVTVAAAFEVPAPDLVFSWRQGASGSELTATVRHLRLAAGATARAGLLVGRHAGCWRPGLGWLVQCYPEYFRPPNPRVFELDGPMIYDFVTTEERLARDLGQGLVWQELGWYWPHLGLYRPAADTWQRQPREQGGLGAGGEVTVAMLNDYIRRARARGVEQCLYFQSTESWAEYAERRFPESRAARPDGTFLPTWIKCVVMNPDPQGPFGRHILDQLRRLTETFPEMAGVFWDQNCYTFFDYAHDDGISLVNGRRVSQLEFAQERMLAAGARFLHDQNRVIMTNGGWTVGLARHCDGHMSEGSGPTRRLQYLCMLKHLTLLSYDSSPQAALEKLKLALETGAQPAVTLGNDACRAQYAGYRPVFDLLRRREWVFEPRALNLPAGLRGNLFRNPAGNLVVTAVADDQGKPTPAERLQPARLATRLADDSRTVAVLEWRPELAGYRVLPSHREGIDRRVDLPRPSPCAGLILARQGRWVVADTARLVAEQRQTVGARLLNLTGEPWRGEWEVVCGDRAVTRSLVVAPGGSEVISVGTVTAPAEVASARMTIRGPQPDGPRGECGVDLPVVAPLELAGPTPEPMQVAQGEEIPFALANHLDRPLSLNLSLAWAGAPARSATLELAAREVRPFNARAEAPASGLVQLVVEAAGAGVHVRRAIAVDVIAPSLPAGFTADTVASLTLTMDLFNSLGGQWAPKTVTVNGVAAGQLPVTGQTLRWHADVTLPSIARAAAREMVRRGLQADGSLNLVVSVDNAVRNCFKAANLRADLRTDAGVTHRSSITREVQCSDSGWLYTEGHAVVLGQPVPLGTLRFLPGR